MADPVAELLSRRNLEPAPPAAADTVEAVGRRFDAALPDGLVRLWRAADGIVLRPVYATLWGATDILQQLDRGAIPPDDVRRGFMPLLYRPTDGEIATLAVRAPLVPRVFQQDGFGDFGLLFRDVDSFLRQLTAAVDAADENWLGADRQWWVPGHDYAPDLPRSAADRADALALLPMADDGPRYAAQLLDAADVDVFAALLDSPRSARQAAQRRMRGMVAPAIVDLLRADEQAFADFAASVADAADRAGRAVGPLRGTRLQVDGRWRDLDEFFHRRRVPDAVDRLVDWFADEAARRDPRGRPDHFFAD